MASLIKKFTKTDGVIVDVVEHTIEILKNNPNVQIHIGTDSQNSKVNTKYATVIAYRHINRGVHYIYSKQVFPKIKNRWERLWNETVFTVDTALWLRDKINIPIIIDMDYSSEKTDYSYILVNAARGWAESLDFKVNIKPFGQVATKAADYECR